MRATAATARCWTSLAGNSRAVAACSRPSAAPPPSTEQRWRHRPLWSTTRSTVRLRVTAKSPRRSAALPTKPPHPRPYKPKQPSLRDRLGRNSLFRTSADLPRVVELDIDALAPNPEQPRTRLDPAALDELRQSIERHGLLQPLLARKAAGGGEGSYELVAGHRRLEALKALGRNTAPAILVSGDPGELALV